ncbi:PAS domain S-box protein [Fusibacter tunisiensis]|uniref:histidine kinase n=1 Tax=Fusibacter tunisiensis TaxID=1008308 RepID=A0ABS2MTH7_9FIRM|nr:PAS domain S-box protein [Fusibacter tunisiensis]MBM7562695.1 PAS domain S-box-containing protein [Fusibacter tunisiensis]
MTETIFLIKMLLAGAVLVLLLRKMIENRSERNIILFMLLFFMLIIDLRSILIGELPVEIYPQMMLLALLVYMIYLIYLGKGSFSPWIINFIDFKNLFDSEIVKNSDEALALVDNKTLKAVASNTNFKNLLELGRGFLTAEEMLVHILQGNDVLEFRDSNHHVHHLKIRLANISSRYVVLFVKEITKQVEMESYLQEEELYYSILWDHAPNMIMIRTLAGEIVYANAAMLSFLKKTEQSIVGRLYTQLYSFKSEAIKHQEINQHISDASDTIQSYLLKYTHMTGETFYMQLTETFVYYKGIKHILTNAIDQTLKVRTDLLVNSYNRIQKNKIGADRGNYIVVDFTTNMILYKDNLPFIKENPLNGYGDFYRALDLESQNAIDTLLVNGTTLTSQPITIFGDFKLLIEEIFRESNGYASGMLIKYVRTETTEFAPEQIGKLVINHIKEGLLIINLEGVIEFANDMILRILDYEKKALVGRSILEISKGLSMDLVRKNWILCKQNASLYFERVYFDRLGNEVPVEITAVLLMEDETEKLVLVVRDSSEKNVYKKKMLDSQTRYTQILESVQDGVFEIAIPDKKVIFYNAFDSEEGLIGLEMTFLQWLNNIHDHDRSVVFEAVDAITAEKKAHMQFEYRYFEKGKWRWIRSTCKFLETEAEAMIVGTNQDISEIKEITLKLEESRQILIESERISGMSHFKYDIDANMFYASETFKTLLGIHAPGETLHYEQIFEKIHNLDQAYFENKFNRFLWEDEPFDVLVRVKVKIEMRFVQLRAVIYKDDDNQPIYAIGTVADITEKVKSREKLQESKFLLENTVEIMPVGIIVVRQYGLVDLVNHRALELLHLTEPVPKLYGEIAEKIGNHFSTVSEKTVEALIKDPEPEQVQVIIKHKKETGGQSLVLSVSEIKDQEGLPFSRVIHIKPIES